mmetsp:Transcript_13676/g.34333  ORF Transcript_13676/g.34333 Transcript_13676/m.34333 type:complete len:265 (-) Transcript_13676:2-796(-)
MRPPQIRSSHPSHTTRRPPRRRSIKGTRWTLKASATRFCTSTGCAKNSRAKSLTACPSPASSSSSTCSRPARHAVISGMSRKLSTTTAITGRTFSGHQHATRSSFQAFLSTITAAPSACVTINSAITSGVTSPRRCLQIFPGHTRSRRPRCPAAVTRKLPPLHWSTKSSNVCSVSIHTSPSSSTYRRTNPCTGTSSFTTFTTASYVTSSIRPRRTSPSNVTFTTLISPPLDVLKEESIVDSPPQNAASLSLISESQQPQRRPLQ